MFTDIEIVGLVDVGAIGEAEPPFFKIGALPFKRLIAPCHGGPSPHSHSYCTLTEEWVSL